MTSKVHFREDFYLLSLFPHRDPCIASNFWEKFLWHDHNYCSGLLLSTLPIAGRNLCICHHLTETIRKTLFNTGVGIYIWALQKISKYLSFKMAQFLIKIFSFSTLTDAGYKTWVLNVLIASFVIREWSTNPGISWIPYPVWNMIDLSLWCFCLSNSLCLSQCVHTHIVRWRMILFPNFTEYFW